ncbi:phage tail tip lysozyme [Fructilactobacillus sp. Tb1]|uniref:phage tail tip lysozyme n=1 Tax=Fructilactobacillus sp. Tb1 TaxID=3422304 RepID=UPI003D2D0BCA
MTRIKNLNSLNSNKKQKNKLVKTKRGWIKIALFSITIVSTVITFNTVNVSADSKYNLISTELYAKADGSNSAESSTLDTQGTKTDGLNSAESSTSSDTQGAKADGSNSAESSTSSDTQGAKADGSNSAESSTLDTQGTKTDGSNSAESSTLDTQGTKTDGSNSAESSTSSDTQGAKADGSNSAESSTSDTQGTKTGNLNSLNNIVYQTDFNDTQIANAKYIYNFFIQQGWSLNAISGMLGNMTSESGVMPDVWEVGGGGGYGLVQWTPGSTLINWCNANNLDYKTLYAQCMRIQYEMTNGIQFFPSSYSDMNAYQYMTSTDSAYDLAMVFLNNYERPAEYYQPARGDYAQEWSNILGNEGVVNFYFHDQDGNTIKTNDGYDHFTWVGDIGTPWDYTNYVPEINGYRYDHVDQYNPTYTDHVLTGNYPLEGPTNVYLTYYKQGVVNFYFHDQDGNTIKTNDGYDHFTWVGDIRTPWDYTNYVPEIDGYRYDHVDQYNPTYTDHVLTGNYPLEGPTNVYLTYYKQGVVNFYFHDQDGNTIKTNDGYDHFTWVGDIRTPWDYTNYVPEIDGYRYDHVDQYNPTYTDHVLTGNYPLEGPTNVYLTYYKQGVVNFYFHDQDGNTIKTNDGYDHFTWVGDIRTPWDYTSSVPEIDGYRYDHVDQYNPTYTDHVLTGNYPLEGPTNVYLTYYKNNSKIENNYISLNDIKISKNYLLTESTLLRCFYNLF